MQSFGKYAQPGSGQFYAPFNLKYERMERLLLINLAKGCPYLGFEPQVFDDPINGRGLRVLAYLPDGVIDVYHEPSLTIGPEVFTIGTSRGQIIPTPFESNRFDITPAGVDVDIVFTDKAGRRIVLNIVERNPKTPVALSLLAPMGSGIPQPQFLPLFMMYDFSFVRRRGTDFTVTIDGQPCQPVSMPVPIGGSWVYFSRYCRDPFILFWNKAVDGPLSPAHPGGAGRFTLDGVDYQLVENDGHFEIVSMSINDSEHAAAIAFDPPFPDAPALRDGMTITGTFTIRSKPVFGFISGTYEAARVGSGAWLRLRPAAGWTPGDPHLSARLIFNVVRLFRRWPATYEWTADLTLSDDGQIKLRSGWRRLV